MKIYLASSWRNRDKVNQVDAVLTAAGHECFNFTNPGASAALPNGFHWSEIDPNWQSWTPEQYRFALERPLAVAGLEQDLAGMRWADAVVGIQPFGCSASFELGWGVGYGKPTAILLSSGEPELMLGLATLCCDTEELISWLKAQDNTINSDTAPLMEPLR